MEKESEDKYAKWRSGQIDDGWMYKRVMESLLKRAEEALEFYAEEAKAEVNWLRDRGERARECLKFLSERHLK